MAVVRSGAGMNPEFPSPADLAEIDDVITDEAAVQTPVGQSLHATPLVKEGDLVAKGAAVANLRHAPEICFVAPISGRVARISLLPGKRLSEIVLYREDNGGSERHSPKSVNGARDLRRLIQVSGIWPWLRRRPFGGMPPRDEVPAAIAVMATDTRPFAPDPLRGLDGRIGDFTRGLAALERLTDGPVLVCQQEDAPQIRHCFGDGRVKRVTCGSRHPQGSAGIRIHQTFPAGFDAPVWDIQAEHVAALGALLETGDLPMMQLVHVAGAALRASRTLRTHPGADIRQLVRRIVMPGPHILMSGSYLDGHLARWLEPRDRQITVLPREDTPRRLHWLIAALTRSAAPKPAIPTAALTQAFGAAVPAAPFVRALGSGDDETAIKLGVLSFLEDDIALADYVLSEGGRLRSELRSMLDRIRTEYAA